MYLKTSESIQNNVRLKDNGSIKKKIENVTFQVFEMKQIMI